MPTCLPAAPGPEDVTVLVQVLDVLCAASEYDEMPVRHNEDKLNATLAQEVRLRVDARSVDDPHTKTNLLLQARSSCSAVLGRDAYFYQGQYGCPRTAASAELHQGHCRRTWGG